MWQGYETLEELYDALSNRQASRERLASLSSHFYALVPHHARLEVIDSMVKLGRKVALLEELSRGLHAEDVVRRCRARNYVDECYALLDCGLFPLARDSAEFARIETYVKNSNCCGRKQDRLELLGVFEVHKPELERRYEPFRRFPNRRVRTRGLLALARRDCALMECAVCCRCCGTAATCPTGWAS